MSTHYPTTCAQCGTEFTSRQPNAKYCTSKCRDRAKYLRTKNSPTPRTQKQCAGCDKTFTPHHPLAAYCTKKCQKTAEARRRRQQKSPNRGTASKTCAICNTTFTPNTPATKYCSSTCRKEAKRKADKEFMRTWRAENPERNAERRKREDPQLRKQRTLRWREQHPDQAKAQAKAYRQAHRASETARMHRWLEDPANKERHRMRMKQWAVRNPGKVAAYRVRRAQAELEGSATRELINAKWEASDKTCCLCGTQIDDTLSSPHPMSFTLEHLTPIARGGTHNLNNIDFSHRACNNKKGTKTLDEYREWMKRTA